MTIQTGTQTMQSQPNHPKSKCLTPLETISCLSLEGKKENVIFIHFDALIVIVK